LLDDLTRILRPRREEFQVERLKAVFDAQWVGLQDGAKIDWDGAQFSERESTWYALTHYFRATPIKADEKPEAVEVSVETDLAKHGLPCLVGVIDLVRSGGRIVDFKLSGKTPDSEQVAHTHEAQLVCYALTYRDATGHREGGVELHHLVRTKTPKLVITSLPPATEHQQTRLFRLIESYQRGLDQQDFVPSPDAFAESGRRKPKRSHECGYPEQTDQQKARQGVRLGDGGETGAQVHPGRRRVL